MKACWYKEGLRFACQACGNCCVSHGENAYVYLTRKDIHAASGHLEISKGELVDRFCEREDRWVHLQNRGADCVFLEEGRCRIYPARPMQCATWPFWTENLDPGEWTTTVSAICPGVGQGRLYGPDEIDRIARARDAWYSILRD